MDSNFKLTLRRLAVAFALCAGLSIGAQPLAMAQATQSSEKIQATGTVTDAFGPVTGVSIMEKGNTTNGTVTDIDGNFSLRVPVGATLLVSSIGYETFEVVALTEAPLNIVLSEEHEMLDQVVVVGFGTQKKVNLTGSVSVTDSEALEERPVMNAAQALQGMVPGLQISVSSGSLETNPSINIRGNGTIGSGSSGSPLILIDGMEGDINTINPQDIESISVLKDAAASSIYGSRAPFGVILVTTKKGSEGKATVNYNNSFRVSSLINMAHTMDSYTFATYFNDGLANTPGQSPFFNDEWLQRIKDYRDGKIPAHETTIPNGNIWYEYGGAHANVDWYDTIYKDHNFSQEHNISVSGGTKTVKYYFSGNVLDQDGMIDWGEENMKRYTVTGKFNADLTDWMTLGYTARWTRRDYIRPATLGGGLYQNIGRQGWPILPVYDPNGFIYDSPSPINGLLNGGDDTTQTDNFYQQLNLVITPVKNWNIHAELNYRILSQNRHWDSQILYNHDVNGDPYVYSSGSNVHEDYKKENFFNVNLYTDYSWTIAEKNNFHVMAGFQTENMQQLQFGLQRDGILIPSLPVVDLTTGKDYYGNAVTPSVNGSKYNWNTAGFFGRINYDYDGRYLFEANLRYDGTSRFRADRRWIWLPSVSAGWNIAKEDFWSGLAPVWNNLKLRGSWGILGNQNTTDWYQTYRLLSIGMSNGSWLQNGAKPNTTGYPALVSQALTWEKVYSWNVGLDWGLFKNRLTGSFDYFIRDTKDMVGPGAELPTILGTDVPKTNNTDLRTHGWDLEISWRDQLQSGFSYGARFVLSDARTKITRYGQNPSQSLSTYIEGRYINEIWGYETIGIAKSDAEMNSHLSSLPNGGQNALGANWAAGDIMYRDLNGDGKVDEGAYTLDDHGDLKLIGNSTPRYQFSLDFDAEWKGFDLRVYLQGVMKRDYWQGSSYFFGIEDNFWWSQGLTEHVDYFRAEPSNELPANLDSYYPRPIFSGGYKNKEVQTRYLQNAAYIRLKNLQLGYTLPSTLTNKIGIERARVFFSGENLWLGTQLSKLFDPETIGSGWGGCAYPLSRTFSFGISLTL